jgi:hypothetical protein
VLSCPFYGVTPYWSPCRSPTRYSNPGR